MGVKVAQTFCLRLATILKIEKEHRLQSMLLEEQSAPLDKKRARSPFYSARTQANASIGLSLPPATLAGLCATCTGAGQFDFLTSLQFYVWCDAV